jgi:hypothetical protein
MVSFLPMKGGCRKNHLPRFEGSRGHTRQEPNLKTPIYRIKKYYEKGNWHVRRDFLIRHGENGHAHEYKRS